MLKLNLPSMPAVLSFCWWRRGLSMLLLCVVRS